MRTRTPHRMETAGRIRDLFAAAAMALGIATWGTLFALLAG